MIITEIVVKKIFPLLAIIICCFACVTAPSENSGARARQVSENLVLKNQITAIERKNTLLEEENNHMRKTVKIKEAEIEKTESNLKAAKEHAVKDKMIFDGKFENLQKKLAILDQESKGKIKNLIALNGKLELKLNKKIIHLNKEILINKRKFAVTIETMKKNNAAKEFNLNTKIISGNEVVSKLKKELSQSKNLNKEKDEELKKQIVSREKHLKKLQEFEGEIIGLKIMLTGIKKEKKAIDDEKRRLLAEISKLSGKK